jgi:hypothetical protein
MTISWSRKYLYSMLLAASCLHDVTRFDVLYELCARRMMQGACSEFWTYASGQTLLEQRVAGYTLRFALQLPLLSNLNAAS